jgi:regulator of PEP synthase PpsR (kinase-PPPase family)
LVFSILGFIISPRDLAKLNLWIGLAEIQGSGQLEMVSLYHCKPNKSGVNETGLPLVFETKKRDDEIKDIALTHPSKDGMEAKPPPIYVVSGGVGASGEQLVHTALAQFSDHCVPVIVVGNVRETVQIDDLVARAKDSGGTIAHTLVDAGLRDRLVSQAQAADVAAIDLMGPLLERMVQVLGREPLGHPGLYRQLHRDYFDRVAAIEFTMAHDDGKKPEGWGSAEIVLVGVSRTGKTPLSLYLSVLGWKVANAPLIPNMSPSPVLFQLDPRRVVGLTIEAGQLLLHRQQRQIRLGVPGPSAYVDPNSIFEEIQNAKQVFRRGGFAVIDVTDRPIETCADEIIRLIQRQAGHG